MKAIPFYALKLMLLAAFLCSALLFHHDGGASTQLLFSHPLMTSGFGASGLGFAFMGQMSPGQARVIDPIITTVVQGFKFPNLVGNTLFPAVPVNTRGGQILSFDKEAFRKYNLRRAPGAATKRIDIGYLGMPYTLLEDSVEGKVPYEILEDAQRIPGVDLAAQYLRTTMNVVQNSLEIDQAALAINPANYGANNKVALAGTAQWSNAASTPVEQMDSYREAIRDAVGIYPNTLLLGPKPFNALKNHVEIVDRFRYTSHESITTAMLASLLNIDTVAVGTAVTWDDINQIMDDVWGDNAILAYVPPAPSSQQEPSFGYTYRMLGQPFAEAPYQDRNAKSWIYPVTYERVPVITSASSAYLIQTPA